jgi:hypothetical protein
MLPQALQWISEHRTGMVILVGVMVMTMLVRRR